MYWSVSTARTSRVRLYVGGGSNLSRRHVLSNDQLAVAAWLAGGITPADAGGRVGVRGRTLKRWLRNPLFQNEVEEQALALGRGDAVSLVSLLLDPKRAQASDPMRMDW